MKKYIVALSFISFIIIFFFSKEIIILTISEKWKESINILKSFALYASYLPLYNFYLTYFKATGMYKRATSIEFINKISLVFVSISILITNSIELTIYILGFIILMSIFIFEIKYFDMRVSKNMIIEKLSMLSIFFAGLFIIETLPNINLLFKSLIFITMFIIHFYLIEKKIIKELKSILIKP